MCRSIKQLRGDDTVTSNEVRAAARQYVRKVSGYREPSQANLPAYEQAIDDIAAATQILLDSLVTRSGRA